MWEIMDSRAHYQRLIVFLVEILDYSLYTLFFIFSVHPYDETCVLEFAIRREKCAYSDVFNLLAPHIHHIFYKKSESRCCFFNLPKTSILYIMNAIIK